MKNIFVLILLFCSFFGYTQETKLDSVIVKMSNDKIAYEQFVNLGKMYFLEKFISNCDVYFQYSGLLYNGFDPFVRIILNDSLKSIYEKTYVEYSGKHFYELALINPSKNYKFIKQYEKFWNSKKSKKIYESFINNKHNYIVDDDSSKYFTDYLENYFIRIPTK